MQMIAGLVTIFKKYRVKLGDGAPLKIKLNPDTFTTAPKQDIHLKFEVRDGWEKRKYKRVENEK